MKTWETPPSLRALAASLRKLALELEAVADGLDMRGVKVIDVRYGPGARSSVTNKLEPFLMDAKRKAAQARR